jgi:GMP synthase (glutamine-hydrolysing)
VDNLSPFTPDILKSLEGLGAKHLCLPYSKVSAADLTNCDRIILSGRRRNSKEINSANSKIIKFCHGWDKPMLGICYGAEIIALTLGGTICRMASHVQGQTAIEVTKTNPLTGERRGISVYESHAYCIARLPEKFDSLASSEYCRHEIFSHESKPIFGTQFHPEKSGRDGEVVLGSFLKV